LRKLLFSRKGILACVACIPLVLMASGCSSVEPRIIRGESPRAFVKRVHSEAFSLGGVLSQRLADLGDIIDFKVSAGKGYCVNLRATKFLQIGIGEGEIKKSGWTKDGARRYSGTWTEDFTEAGICFAYIRNFISITRISGKTPVVRKPKDALTALMHIAPQFDLENNLNRELLGVGLSLHVLVGVEAELKLTEIADFIAGFIGIDFKRDDLASRYVDFMAKELARAPISRTHWFTEATTAFKPADQMKILFSRWRKDWPTEKKRILLEYVLQNPDQASVRYLKNILRTNTGLEVDLSEHRSKK